MMTSGEEVGIQDYLRASYAEEVSREWLDSEEGKANQKRLVDLYNKRLDERFQDADAVALAIAASGMAVLINQTFGMENETIAQALPCLPNEVRERIVQLLTWMDSLEDECKETVVANGGKWADSVYDEALEQFDRDNAPSRKPAVTL